MLFQDAADPNPSAARLIALVDDLRRQPAKAE